MAKILVVDDDVDLIEYVKLTLGSKKHEVISAHDGKSGFAAAKEKRPDLIILDVMMATETEGFEIAQALKAEKSTKSIPIIILTGVRKVKGLPFKFEPDEDWLPVKAVLEKPVDPPTLVSAVNEALA